MPISDVFFLFSLSCWLAQYSSWSLSVFTQIGELIKVIFRFALKCSNLEHEGLILSRRRHLIRILWWETID